MCDEVDTITVDTCHSSVEVAAEVELHQVLAVQLGFGDDDTAGDELFLIRLPVEVDRCSDKCCDGINVLRSCHDEKFVVEMQHCLAVDDDVMVVIAVLNDT